VTLELAPAARWLAEQVPVESVEDADGGEVRVSLRIGDPAWLRALLLREAGNIRGVEPESAAWPAAEAARSALEAYGSLET